MTKSTAFVIAGTAIFLGNFALAADLAPPRTLIVTGTGQAKAAPDEANFSAGVVAQGVSAREALAANSKAMNAVIASLKHQGVPDKAIQTANISLNPQYTPCKPNVACTPKISGYEVSNTVMVTTGIDKAGPVLDALVASGANQIGGISFAIHDPKPLLSEARTEAVKDAMDRAQTIAKAAGITLGSILSINEGGSYVPQPMFKAAAMRAMAQEAMPVAGGEETLSANVSITFEIK
ncbi:hypothetical protein FHS83_001330 [Rhizomicrobium palustre]|uniref:SIMPL domain-containing protein n=1 Tax=Rhizomicrobium palustre TaxID=189966 RepID=A0A846MY85_9PROT|nr:SIMPL domain-containing protein [Rhizomicrobium palustre]NIK88012.1 hypothetical protein [Rhizomicrobium palustre]